MKRACWIVMCLWWVTALCAQEFGTHWIGVTDPDSFSHVWFRQAYLEQRRPQWACVTVVSSGYYKLYVNECNVGTAVLYPTRQPLTVNPVSMTFDVTPYLRPDTNVVALCYAPTYPHVDSCQVSVSFYGVDGNGKAFCRNSDGNWLSRRANSRWTSDGQEVVDGRYHNTSWKAACFDQGLWRTVAQRRGRKIRHISYLSAVAPVLRHVHTDGCLYFDRDSSGVSYEFGEGFHGLLRLTLRGARSGQRVVYGGLEYVCNGELDEQAFPVFRMGEYRRVRVTGDKRFRQDLITTVEALKMAYETCDDGIPWQ